MVINVNSSTKTNIFLGNQGENGVTQIQFDVSEWQTEFGEGSLTVVAQRHGDDLPYPVVISNNIWTVSDADTAKRGTGKIQVAWVVNGKIKKSVIHNTLVEPSLDENTVDPPDPYDNWVEYVSEVNDAADTAYSSATIATAKASEATTSASSASTSAQNAATSETNSETKKLQSEGFAVGEQDGVEVGSSSPYYHNNAKYYAEQASSASQSAEDSEASALVSEGYALGKQDGTDVGSTSPYYQNNSKYYSQQAAGSEANASQSEADAEASALVSEGYAVGKQDGTDVGSSSPYYQNNAKYYADVARINYGSPLNATEAADMTETNRVYVYTGSETGYTAGDWYYYDGSDWVDGGAYNSSAINTDTTLSVSGMAADSKTVGDAIDAITPHVSGTTLILM